MDEEQRNLFHLPAAGWRRRATLPGGESASSGGANGAAKKGSGLSRSNNRKQKGMNDVAANLNAGPGAHNMKGLMAPEDHDREMQRIEKILGEGEYAQVKHMLAALLNLRDVTFSGAESVVIDTPDELEAAADNLGVPKQELEEAMCTKSKKFGKEIQVISISETDATYARDALLRHLYKMVFSHIEDRACDFMESVFDPRRPRSASHGSVGSAASDGGHRSSHYTLSAGDKSIVLLDCFGYEIFEENLLGQFVNQIVKPKFYLKFS